MLVLDGRKVEVPGVVMSNFLDNPKLKFTDKADYGLRKTQWVRSIVYHTRMGISPQSLVANEKDRKWDFKGVSRASGDTRHCSWHISIDSDGSAACHLDIVRHKAYHATHMNDISVGIEMFQDSNGGITQATLNSAVLIGDVLTRELGIQRQFPSETKICTRFASPFKRHKHTYLPGGKAGKDYCGLLGHRNLTRNRGRGDPGDLIWIAFANANYQRFAVDLAEDQEVWALNQSDFLMYEDGDCDGVPGPGTVRDLKAMGIHHGIWVLRPGDGY